MMRLKISQESRIESNLMQWWRQWDSLKGNQIQRRLSLMSQICSIIYGSVFVLILTSNRMSSQNKLAITLNRVVLQHTVILGQFLEESWTFISPVKWWKCRLHNPQTSNFKYLSQNRININRKKTQISFIPKVF